MTRVKLDEADRRRHAASRWRRALAFGALWLFSGRAAADALDEAEALAHAGKLEEAAAAYTRVLDRSPAQREALVGRSRIRGWLGDGTGALEDLGRVLAADREDREARTQRARVLGWMQRYAEAEQDLSELLARHPRDAEAQLTLGDVLGWQGRFDEALRRYEGASAAAPRDPRPWVALGRTRFWLGDLQAAREAYEQALRIAPGDEEAAQGLRRIERVPRERRARIDAGFRYDVLAGEDWQQTFARLGVRVFRQASLLVGVDHHHRFGAHDVQATLGADLGLPTRGRLSASVSLGPGAEVVARRAYEAELAQPVGGGWIASLRYRHADFAGGIHSDLVSPGIDFGATRYARVLARYTHSFVSGEAQGHSGSARLVLFPEARLGLQLGAAWGTEAFAEARAPQLPSEGRVRGASGRLVWRARESVAVGVGYEYEDVAHAYTRHGISSDVSLSF